MKPKKKHLRGLFSTLCGISSYSLSGCLCETAKKFAAVTCKRCMNSPEYKNYLEGKYKEKPVAKDLP